MATGRRIAEEPIRETRSSARQDRNHTPEKPHKTGEKGLKPAALAGILIAAVVVVLLAAYCILCVWVRSGDTLRTGTSVNGVDLGGLTREEAVDRLTQQLDRVTTVDGTDYASLDLVVEGVDTYTVDFGSSLGYDVDGAVETAFADQQGGSFFVQGFRFLKSLGREHAYTILPFAAERTQVEQALRSSGILELNTTRETTWERTDDTLEFTMGVTGVSVNEESLVEQIMEQTARGDFSPISCPLVETPPAEVDLQAVYDELYTDPCNATLDVAEDKSYTIVPSEDGISFDVDQAQQTLSSAQEDSLVRIDLIRTAPDIDTAALEEGLFRDVLGEYTTSVTGTSNRLTNVKLSAAQFDGTILLPGDVFSYNEVVGERTEEAGYKEASAYNNGETVLELGGGICQGSSTLYCAVLYANLEVVLRYCHTYVSSYVPLGMDATVSWGGPDFQFCNNTDYPIQVVATYSSNNKLTCQILGTKVDDYTVKITSETLSVTQPTVKEVEDDTLDVGTTKTTESGHTGYKVQTYRQVYDGAGNLVSETEEAYSSYKMTEKVVHVGTREVEEEQPEEGEGTAETPTADSGGGETSDGGD